jgi:hypothetical protein
MTYEDGSKDEYVYEWKFKWIYRIL